MKKRSRRRATSLALALRRLGSPFVLAAVAFVVPRYVLALPLCEATRSPSYELSDPFGVAELGNWARSTAIGDVTGDGLPDIVATTSDYSEPNPYHVWVVPQLAAGGFGTIVGYPYGAYTYPFDGLALADMNADGTLDVVVGKGNGVSVLLAGTAGSLLPAMQYLGPEAHAVDVLEFNGDGLLDVVTVGVGTDGRVHLGDGAGGFIGSVDVALFEAVPRHDVEAGDLNGDGLEDFAVCSSGSWMEAFLSNGDGSYVALQPYYFESGCEVSVRRVASVRARPLA